MPFISINPTKTNPRTNSWKIKIEGTLILKLAMVERLKVNKNLSKKNLWKIKNVEKVIKKFVKIYILNTYHRNQK